MNVAAHLGTYDPDRVAVHQWNGRSYDRLTHGALDRDSDEIACGLHAVGVSRGTRTVLMVPPGRDFFALAFGMAKAGVVPVLVDPGMGVASLGACLREAAPSAFIGIPRAHLARIALGWCRDTLVTTISTGFGALADYSLDDVRAAGSRFEIVDADRDEVAAILFTSGSTGAPKGVVYTHGNFAEQIASLRRISSLGSDEIDLATFPPFALFDPALGMTTVVPDMDFSKPASANPATIVDAITTFGATNLFCSPALLDVIARHGVAHATKLPSLRRVISAGAPVPRRVIDAFASMLSPTARVLTPYGATEALPVSLIANDELPHGTGVCVGAPVPGVEVAIIPITDERVGAIERVPTGTLGEIVVRGDVVTHGYFGRPRDTELARIGAWHRMGDVGFLDESGRIWFCGRKAECVRVSERVLTPVECEAVFADHPDVERCALVAVDGKPALCVQTRSPSPKLVVELRALARSHAATTSIETFLFHPKLPVDSRHNAKIRRGELAAWAASQLA